MADCDTFDLDEGKRAAAALRIAVNVVNNRLEEARAAGLEIYIAAGTREDFTRPVELTPIKNLVEFEIKAIKAKVKF